jgi:hypothetical protein
MSLRKALNDRRIRFARGVQVSLLSGMAGGFGGVLAALAGKALAPASSFMAMSALGGLLGAGAYLGLAYLVIYSMHNMEHARTVRAAAAPLGGTLLLAVVIALACILPAFYVRWNQVNEMRMAYEIQERLWALHRRLLARTEGNPESLQELLDSKEIEADALRAASLPDRAIGFFYLKPERISREPVDRRKQIYACEFANQARGGKRMVLYTFGRVEDATPQRFRDILDREENRAFREALQKAEGLQERV